MFEFSGIFFKDLIYLKKWDFIIIFIILAIAGGMYMANFNKEQGGFAIIYVSGDEKERLNLLEDKAITIETTSGYNVVQVKDGKVKVIDADCRDKICVNHVPVSFTKEMIICLPHRLIVEITGTENSGIDAISR